MKELTQEEMLNVNGGNDYVDKYIEKKVHGYLDRKVKEYKQRHGHKGAHYHEPSSHGTRQDRD